MCALKTNGVVYIYLSLLNEHMGRRITDNYTDNGDVSVDPEIFSVCFPAGAHREIHSSDHIVMANLFPWKCV